MSNADYNYIALGTDDRKIVKSMIGLLYGKRLLRMSHDCIWEIVLTESIAYRKAKGMWIYEETVIPHRKQTVCRTLVDENDSVIQTLNFD